MTQETIQKIKNNPKYKQLTKSRNLFAWTLSIIMLVVYYAFILVLAFEPQILGTKLGDSVITVGIPVGLAIIVIAFVLSGVYVNKANGEFDRLTREIKEELGDAA
jgi:uncharacterized membrane protein (DUF485 family)